MDDFAGLFLFMYPLAYFQLHNVLEVRLNPQSSVLLAPPLSPFFTKFSCKINYFILLNNVNYQIVLRYLKLPSRIGTF